MSSALVQVTAAGRSFDIEHAWVGVDDPSAPLIVFLHEGLGSLSMWKDFPQQLCQATNARGLVYSRPGYGRSTPRAPDERWGLDFMHVQARELLPALLLALGIDAAVHKPWLFGHSDGGSIALIHAALFPNRVAGAVVMAPHILVEEFGLKSIRETRRAYRDTDLREKLSRHHADVDSAFWGWNDVWLDDRFPGWTIEAMLTAIRCPVLAIQGVDDPYGTMEQIDGIARRVPGTQLLKLEGCGHSPHRDQPQAVISRGGVFRVHPDFEVAKMTTTAFFDDPQHLAPPRVLKTLLPGGGFVLRSPETLQPYARCIGEWLERWAAETPDASAIAERDAAGAWRRLSWSELRHTVGRVAQGLLDLNLPAGRPVVVLSDNAVDHALLMLAAMHVGRPVCTVSSAYSRTAKDLGKIRGILRTLEPALVYASDATVYGAALADGAAGDAVTVFSQNASQLPGAIAFDRLTATPERADVANAFEAIAPDDHAKYLLTSGSTGTPKVVINTHRMLCANQQMIAQTWRFLDTEKPVILDWLPWSHTFGGNHNLNLVLRNGGTLYIDDGRPAPGLVEKTVRNLREVRPTLYFNVPRGFDMLLPHLEQDDALARETFSRLRLMFYAGAALPQASWERLEAVARKVRDEPVWFTTSWGSTETAPAVTSAHWKLDRAGVIGLPLPELELKFVPNGEKHELRVRGVSVFPGYRNEPALTAQAFDEDGFYRIGDAGLLLDDASPERGVVFDGRVAEDFKLTTGTWVSVGTLRVKLVSALAPLAQDAVITGHDRDEVGALIFPSAQAKALSPEALMTRVREVLQALRAEGGGSSHCPTRVLVLTEPPDADAGEITDKGYVNQRAVLHRRAAEVAALYSAADSRVISSSP